MKKNWSLLVFVSLILGILVIGKLLNINLKKNKTEANLQTCIPPIVDFSYLTTVDKNNPAPRIDFNVTPQNPWYSETSIPNLGEETNYKYGVSIVRGKEDYTEVWVQIFEFNNQNLIFDYKYAIYKSDTKSWSIINGTVNNNESLYISNLFVDKKGRIWGQNYWGQTSYDANELPLFSIFDDTTNSFLLVEETKSIPAFLLNNQGNLWIEKPQSISILDINAETFWVFAHKEGIYSYNITTQKIEKHKDLDVKIKDITLDKDGNIYYNFINMDNNSSQSLRFFSVRSNEIKNVPINLTLWTGGYSNILVDHTGNLWLDSVGWKTPTEDWYQIHPPSIFVTNLKQGALDSRFQYPQIEIESSDNRLWFSSDNGMVWLDPEKGEWCWFTTYQSNIVEDSDRNLWMIADNKLYKLPLGEQ